MELRTEIRRRLRSARDWNAGIEDLGRETGAKVGEREVKAEKEEKKRPALAALVGEALLDLGQKDRAAEVLGAALEATPDSLRIREGPPPAQDDAAEGRP